jgi:hypothetical protein
VSVPDVLYTVTFSTTSRLENVEFKVKRFLRFHPERKGLLGFTLSILMI